MLATSILATSILATSILATSILATSVASMASYTTGRARNVVVSRAPSESVMGSILNLNGPAHYVHWHFFLMSVPNLIVIVLMLIVFVGALFLRAPGAGKRGASK